MTNAEARHKLIKEYGCICFMGGELSCKNILTTHHLTAVRDGGKTTLDNLALLGRLQHDIFNLVELHYKKKANDMNDLFREYKEIRDNAIIEYLKLQSQILLESLEYEIEDKGNIYVLKKRCYTNED